MPPQTMANKFETQLPRYAYNALATKCEIDCCVIALNLDQVPYPASTVDDIATTAAMTAAQMIALKFIVALSTLHKLYMRCVTGNLL